MTSLLLFLQDTVVAFNFNTFTCVKAILYFYLETEYDGNWYLLSRWTE